MPTIIAHGAAGIASAVTLYGGRWKFTVAAASVVCAALPDADAVTFIMGIPYGHMFGHRGFSHSLFFAAAAAGIFTILFKCMIKSAGAAAMFFCLFLAGASHGVLDAMTDGGLGVAFFAPFSEERFFFPWRPIPVSPIAVNSSSMAWILRVLRFEAAYIVLPCCAAMFPAVIIRIVVRRLRRDGPRR